MEPKSASMNHGPIFILLVALVFSSVGVHLLHLSPAVNNWMVLGIACVMAGLVVAHYMGLKWEGILVDWIVVVPLVLFAILMVVLLPDLGGSSFKFFAGH
jgi:caa(3)-type oxidase subunit IV